MSVPVGSEVIVTVGTTRQEQKEAPAEITLTPMLPPLGTMTVMLVEQRGLEWKVGPGIRKIKHS